MKKYGDKLNNIVTIIVLVDVLAAICMFVWGLLSEQEVIGIVSAVAIVVVSIILYYVVTAFGAMVDNVEIIAHKLSPESFTKPNVPSYELPKEQAEQAQQTEEQSEQQ